jgi:hypothetical protein
VGDIALAIACGERDGDSASAYGRITRLGGCKDVKQAPTALRFEREQSAARGAQHIGLGDHSVSTGVGVNDPAGGVHDDEAGRELVERVGKRCGLDAMKINHLADQHGSANTGGDQLETWRMRSSTGPSRAWRIAVNSAQLLTPFSRLENRPSVRLCGASHSRKNRV